MKPSPLPYAAALALLCLAGLCRRRAGQPARRAGTAAFSLVRQAGRRLRKNRLRRAAALAAVSLAGEAACRRLLGV